TKNCSSALQKNRFIPIQENIEMINQKYRGLALPLMLLAPTVLAGNIDTIEELIITASPHDKRAEELPGAITVLDRRALQREVSATLGETLQNQPGMHSSSF